MSTSEKDLDTIFGQGQWEAPNLLDLRMAFTSLDSTMKALAESPGWEGASAAAASEKWIALQKKFGLVAGSVDEVRSLIAKGNAALAKAKEAVDGAPAVIVPKEIKQAAAAADAGAEIWVPALGKYHPASTVVKVFESFLGNKRAEAADAAKATLETELAALAASLNGVDFGVSDTYDVPEPQKPEPIIVPSDRGGTPPPPTPTIRTGGGYPPPPVYSNPGPTYPPGYPRPPVIISDPGPPVYGDPHPPSPKDPPTSVDNGGTGTVPGGHGVTDPRIGGGGSHNGVNGAVFGGAAAAGAVALKFGTGGGFGGGGMGGGGLGAGGAGGSGGLLGSGAGSAGGAGAAGSGAGAGSGAAGAGAGAGKGGGMMGGQQMGGAGGQGGKKEKRAGLGGLIAPKLEDDETEFVPLPDGARAGGRDITTGDES